VSAPEWGPVLLGLARASLLDALKLEHPGTEHSEPWLDDPGACFVTLRRLDRLRGCVGSVRAYRPLREDVWSNARAAAFSDTRFPPVRCEEMPEIRLEVSLLSAPEPVVVTCEEEACRILRPGSDGVIFEWGGSRSTFLPQVWEQLADPLDFLGHLKHKAGLPTRFWAPDVKLWRYAVTKWEEAPSLRS
jgi:AmmeMemoRadiSam system protein A